MFGKKQIEEESLLQQLSNIKEPTTFTFKEIRSADKSMPMFQLLVKNSNNEYVVAHQSKVIEYSFHEVSNIIRIINKETSEDKVNFIIAARSSAHYGLYKEKLDEILKDIKTKEESSIIIKEIDVTKINKLTTEQIKSLFVDFCWHGNLSCLKDLVENSFLGSSAEKDKRETATIADVGFHRACSGGHLSVVKYLQENTAINDLISTGGVNDGLVLSLSKGHKEVVKYLMTECDIKPDNWCKSEIEKLGLKDLIQPTKPNSLKM